MRHGDVPALLIRLALVGVICVASGCGDAPDPRFSTPAATYGTFQKAVQAEDYDLLWSCYSTTYREHISGGRQQWEAGWRQRNSSQRSAEASREIAEEQVIGDDVAFLRFDPTSLPDESSGEFFYLVLEESGWLLTTHLDGVFHRRLEQALQSGALKLPPP